MIRLLALAALVMAGCSSLSPDEDQDWTLRLAPEPALADIVEVWAARWSAATGRTILVGTEGTPVVTSDELPHLESDTLDCGQTSAVFHTRTGVWMSTEWVAVDVSPPHGCPIVEYTIAHEIGHALSACKHTEEESSLLHATLEPGQKYVIDEASLALVCATSWCQSFAPELVTESP